MQGRHIVVTGGRGALGQAVVTLLRARGAIVHAPTRAELSLDDERATAAFYAGVPAPWASIHLVGGFAMAPVEDTSLADLEAMWRLNAVTCFLACREAIASMRRRGGGPGAGGRIVNVAARPVLAPVGGMVAYAAAKASVAAITQSLAVEVRKEGILVNAVVPSTIDTPANRAAMPTADHASWPTPSELAQTIAFLASPENTVTSGGLIPVFGRA